jgi:uncharacterized protein (TIGR03437 family)
MRNRVTTGFARSDGRWVRSALFFGIAMAIAEGALPGQTLTTLYTFTGGQDGGGPKGTLVTGSDGNLYGTSGNNVFKITPSGTLTTLHTLSNTEGVGLFGSLALGRDGNFYGTAVGSSPGAGTIFQVTPGGAFKSLHTFNVTDGNGPWGGLVLGSDGNFYGTTSAGGVAAAGTAFRITPAGAFTNLYTFSVADGIGPHSSLAVGSDGNLYGTAIGGGANSAGTVFRITPAGTFTNLHSFVPSEGASPWGTLLLGSDGNFYGTTALGGAFGQGTVFQLAPSGTIKTLHSFSGADGQGPLSGLTLGPDGNFYGTAQTGGASTLFGTLFKITSGGTFTSLYSFSGTDGSFPYGGLTLGSDGNLYGTTSGGGKNAVGTVFRLNLTNAGNSPAISANGVVNGASFQQGISPNSWATIQGRNLSPVTDNWNNFISNSNLPTDLDGVKVTIGGQPAYLSYISPEQINLLVPSVGSGELQVSVTNSAGTSSSATVTCTQYAPTFFEWPGNQAVATRQDFTLAAKSGTFAGVNTVPAKAGEVIILWGTGFGPTTPAAPAGVQVPSNQTYSTSALPAVTINGVPATVYGAALAPGYAGLYQIAIQVPDSLGNGDWPIQVNIAGTKSLNPAVLSVQQ